MAALERHDNVVQVLDAGDWDSDHVYIASAFCNGGSLESSCTPPNLPLDPATACQHISGVCRGLDLIHRGGLLHLDIRPANILLHDGVPKLGDFGLARWITDPQIGLVYAKHAAPELLQTGQGSMAADQYSMAMTLLHLVSGGASCVDPPRTVTAQSWKGIPAVEGHAGPNLPRKLIRVLKRATSFAAPDRYASIEDFKRAVDAATPRTSFVWGGGFRIWTANDDLAIEWSAVKTGWAVDVRRSGRRIAGMRTTDLTLSERDKYLASLVTTTRRASDGSCGPTHERAKRAETAPPRTAEMRYSAGTRSRPTVRCSGRNGSPRVRAMGAWGVGIYENDDAADWRFEVAESGLAAVEAALDSAIEAEYVEAPDGACALAAADVVARLVSGRGDDSAYSEDVRAWLAEKATPPSPSLNHEGHEGHHAGQGR